MSDTPISRSADGFYHPASEAEVIALVNFARAEGKQVRARGATHSVAFSIYTDPVGNLPPNMTLEQVPPAGNNIDIAFDRMMALTWIDDDAGIVEAQPGIHLGFDPSDPFGVSTLANSFLYQIFQKGWAVNNLGGITHQTISGFTGTGSAGGSVIHSFDNVTAYRVVDGLGQATWIEQGDPAFPAMLTHCGLLGIVTAMRFQLVPMYNVTGTEITTTTGGDCPIDLFGPGVPAGPGGPAKPSLQQFFAETPYSRMTWWPQKGCERVQIWQADRVPASDLDLVPYQQFTPGFSGQTSMLLASLFFVLLGNTNLGTILGLLRKNVLQYFLNLARLWESGLIGGLRGVLSFAGAAMVSAGVFLIGALLGLIPGVMRGLFHLILPLFNPVQSTAKATRFSDWYWRSLCMDNTADDVLLGTEFVEIWLPIQYTQQVMNLLRTMFEQGGPAATGILPRKSTLLPPARRGSTRPTATARMRTRTGSADLTPIGTATMPALPTRSTGFSNNIGIFCAPTRSRSGSTGANSSRSTIFPAGRNIMATICQNWANSSPCASNVIRRTCSSPNTGSCVCWAREWGNSGVKGQRTEISVARSFGTPRPVRPKTSMPLMRWLASAWLGRRSTRLPIRIWHSPSQ